MIDTLFLIENEKQYRLARKVIEAKKIDDFSMLSWSENESYINDKYSYLKGVMKWGDFQVKDITLNSYWLNHYEQIEGMVRGKIESFSKNEIARSDHFIFGLVWKLGDSYYKYIDALDIFFQNHKPKKIYFSHKRNFISDLMLSFVKLYGARHEELAI